MFLGIDASTQREVDAKNPHYFYGGQEVDPWRFMFSHNGVKGMRLRLWIDPYDEEGKPYGGGTVDFPTFLALAKRAKEDGYHILLDFHYSDFWCDPSKQCIPKSWRGLSLEETATKLYEYTKKTLLDIKKEGIEIPYIQIGNEITNGMLWPLGQLVWQGEGKVRRGYDNLAVLLQAGLRAVKEVLPFAQTVIHLEKSYDVATHEEFYREILLRGTSFDIIGLSYYPYWHGTFEMFFKNVNNLQKKFHKPVWIVETGYGFTMEPFVLNGNYGDNLISEDFFKQGNVYRPFPLSKEGQRSFVKELIARVKLNDIGAIYYWEPFWLPLEGLEWASKEGEKYIGETNKPTHNEWANQCLFDYDGNATPALDEFKL